MGSWAAVSFSDGLVRGLRHSATSEVLRLPGVVEGSQSDFCSCSRHRGHLPLLKVFFTAAQSDQWEGRREGGSLAALLQVACLQLSPQVDEAAVQSPFPAVFTAKPLFALKSRPQALKLPPPQLGRHHSPEG